ncbi:MAG: rhomboid family intramembrane serine protease [Promethearchaeota archaeon]
MAKCSYPDCDEILNYLPFKCRYCGDTFCKKHRLPENHQCSFELQIKPQKEVSKEAKSFKEKVKQLEKNKIPENKTYEQIDREMRNFIHDQERAAMPPPPSRSSGRYGSRSRGYSPFISRTNKPIGTYSIMGITIFFFLLTYYPPIQQYILLNLNYFISSFIFHIPSIFTSSFTPELSGYLTPSWISLIFTLLILFWSGKVIETRMGTKFLLSLYILSGIANGFAILLLQSLGLLIQNSFFFFNIAQISFPFSTQNGAYYGLMVFLLYQIGLNREMRFYLYFIPIRMKAKYILYFIAGMQLAYGIYGIIILILQNPNGAYYILSSFPQLAGILVGAYFWKRFGRQVVNFV